MSDHRYKVKIWFDASNSKTVEVVLEEARGKRVFLIYGSDLIPLNDCSHDCANPSEPIHATSKLKLKGLGCAFGLKLKDKKYDSGSKSFKKNTKSGIVAAGDWEASDNGPFPHLDT